MIILKIVTINMVGDSIGSVILKNFSTLLLTVVGMLIILFLVLLFFTLMHNVYTFVRLLYNEMMFRL